MGTREEAFSPQQKGIVYERKYTASEKKGSTRASSAAENAVQKDESCHNSNQLTDLGNPSSKKKSVAAA